MTRAAIPIVALDVASAEMALRLAAQVAEHCRFFKIGSELFTAAGPNIVRAVRENFGADVFLDLKFHDIPNTVARSVASAVALGVRLLTVHTSGGPDMLHAAQEAAGTDCGILGVTVLTSLDEESLSAAWGRESVVIREEVLRLAASARAANLHGIVCGGDEAVGVRSVHGDALAMLVPGIRLEGSSADDQRRVVTPKAARDAGARYLILGRAVTGASSPGAAMQRVLAEVADEA